MYFGVHIKLKTWLLRIPLSYYKALEWNISAMELVTLSNENTSKLAKWREKYAALAVAFACLYSLIDSWGKNWILTSILGLGVLFCGTMAFFDIKRVIHNRRE